MRRILRKFQINEISAVGRPAQTAAQAVIMKSATAEAATKGDQNDPGHKRQLCETHSRARRRTLSDAADTGKAFRESADGGPRRADLLQWAERRAEHERTRAGGVTRGRGRAMAKAVGVSLRTVQRLWDAHRLQPHRLRTFKRSNDPKFAEKVEDVVGLYMDPPAHAVVVSIDEKSQIQALDRTQPGLPLKPGKCGTMTHDYKRNGTTTLFAALNVLDGTVVGRCMPKHTYKEFIKFLNAMERTVPAIHYVPLGLNETTCAAQSELACAYPRVPQSLGTLPERRLSKIAHSGWHY